jgi:hypothetical protein
MLHEVESRHSGHTDVGNNAIERPAAICDFKKVLRRLKASGPEVLPFEIELQRVAYGFVVVDERNMDRISHDESPQQRGA